MPHYRFATSSSLPKTCLSSTITFMLRRTVLLLTLLLVSCQQPQSVTPPEPTPETTNPTLDNPSNFSAVSTAPDVVELSWSAPSGATGYWLERATNSGNYQSLKELRDVTSFRDSSVLPNTTYHYHLFSYDNTSLRSSGVEISVTTLPPIIPDTTYIQGDARSSTTIELQWLEVFGATSYKVERKTETGSFLEVALLLSGTSFKDVGLTPDTTYIYRVRTQTDQGLSVGAEIMRRTYNTKSWTTPIEMQRDPKVTPAFVTPIPGKGAVFGEYGESRTVDGTYYTDRHVSFIDSSGIWGPSDLLDFSPNYPLATNSKGEVMATWYAWNRLYVKRYSDTSGWTEVEQINSGGDENISWSSITLSNDGTAHLVWQQGQKLLVTSSSGQGIWSPAHALESVTGAEHIFWILEAPRIVIGSSGATFAIWTTETGDRESYKLRVSRRIDNTWTPAETLVNEDMFDIKYDLNIQSDGSATLVWANGPVYALQFTPSAGWSERRVLTNGYYGSRYEKVAGNDNGLVAMVWRKDHALYGTVYTPELGWNYNQLIMDNLSSHDARLTALLVTPEGEIFVIAVRGDNCKTIDAVKYKVTSGWSEPIKVSGDNCLSSISFRLLTWLNSERDPTAIINGRFMTKFE